jgi:hypothetical protein
MTIGLLTQYARAHIAGTIVGMPLSSVKLPGGIHGGVAPEETAYPFAVMSYAGGADINSFSSGLIGGGLLYQIKVVDIGGDEAKAATAYAAIAAALVAANNSPISGAYVAGQEESPFDLPLSERDQTFQQIGGNWRFWVDPI